MSVCKASVARMYLALELVSSSSSVEVNCLLSSSELLPAELLEESTLRALPSALELSPLEKSDEERTCICGQKMLRALQLLHTSSRSAALEASVLDGRIHIKSSRIFL